MESNQPKPKKAKIDPGPELPTDESQTAIAYISYEEIENPLVFTTKEEEMAQVKLFYVLKVSFFIAFRFNFYRFSKNVPIWNLNII